VSFALDPRLAADTRLIGDLPLCRALLMNDARFVWLILVPRRDGLVEITDLGADERAQLMQEAAQAAAALRRLPQVEKINIGALGNIVRQLHMHVVGRSVGDAAWPGPVWGSGPAVTYEADACEARLVWLRRELRLG
jgi:diadenosine tetraphosphate (Ap4A) HIT family hydrolase